VGDSMAGKSTLALALLHGGGRLLSDDLVLGRVEADRFRLSALRQDLYVREGSLGLIPAPLRSLFADDGSGSGRRVLRRSLAQDRFVDEVAPQVLWFLDGHDRPQGVEVSGMSQAEALGLLFRQVSPLFLSRRYDLEREAQFPGLLRLVQSTACYKVRLGPDLLQAPAEIVQELVKRTAKR
jgi:hypothetical protein